MLSISNDNIYVINTVMPNTIPMGAMMAAHSFGALFAIFSNIGSIFVIKIIAIIGDVVIVFRIIVSLILSLLSIILLIVDHLRLNYKIHFQKVKSNKKPASWPASKIFYIFYVIPISSYLYLQWGHITSLNVTVYVSANIKLLSVYTTSYSKILLSNI